MNRPIKFRGISPIEPPSNWWYYGNLITEPMHISGTIENGGVKTFIRPDDGNPNGAMFEVKPETVGQFTGLLDKNGKEIYEGDIVVETYARISGRIETHCLFVKWDDYGARWSQTDDIAGSGFGTSTSLTKNGEYEVIGNIYESPTLLTP